MRNSVLPHNMHTLYIKGVRRVALSVAVCAIMLCGFSACEKEASKERSPKYEYFVKQINSQVITADIVKYMLGNDPMIGALLDQQPSQRIIARSISYHTTDPQGNAVVASGVFFLPRDLAISEIKGVVIAEHGTILKNAEVPSQALFQSEGILAFAGYAVIMPDLLGFGTSYSLPHPYLHAANTAKVTADMVFATQECVAAEDKPLSGPMYVVGYSQGGHSALAFQQFAEEKYSEKLPLTKVIAGAGPYDLTATFDDFVKTDYTSYPCSVPYIALGLDYGDNIGLNFTNLFGEKLLASYTTWYNKTRTADEVNKLLGTTKISDFMHADMFTEKRNADFDKLHTSLAKNSLLNWTPRTPLRLFHGTDDTVVPPLNSEKAFAAFKAKGCDVELKTVAGDHGDVFMQFYLYVFNELK